MSGINPELLQILQLLRAAGNPGAAQGGGMALPMGNSGMMQPSLQQLLQMREQANQQPMRQDIQSGLPMGNSGMMQPGLQQLLAMRDAANAQPMRPDVATGLPMGNSGMMQPGLQELLAMQAADPFKFGSGPGGIGGAPQGAQQGPPAGFTPPPPPGMGGQMPNMPQGGMGAFTPGPPPPSMKKGGVVKKTGVYTLHKGETVVPAQKTKTKAAYKEPAHKPTPRKAAPPPRTSHESARHATRGVFKPKGRK